MTYRTYPPKTCEGFSAIQARHISLLAVILAAGCSGPSGPEIGEPGGTDKPGIPEHIHDRVVIDPGKERLEVLEWTPWEVIEPADASPSGANGTLRRFASKARTVRDVQYGCSEHGALGDPEVVQVGDFFAYDADLGVGDSSQKDLYGQRTIPAGEVFDPESALADEPGFKGNGNGTTNGLKFPDAAAVQSGVTLPENPTNPIGIISSGSFSGGIYPLGATYCDSATEVVCGILEKISQNAGQIQGFANWVVDRSGEETAQSAEQFFGGLATAQNAIRTSVTAENLTASFAAAQYEVAGILSALGITDSATAKTLYDGYAAGHYLWTRDWRSAGVSNGNILSGDQSGGRLAEYEAAIKAAGGVFPTGNGSSADNRRGITLPNMSNFGTATGALAIENALVAEVAGRLAGTWGISDADKSELEPFVRALIIQCGQDIVGLEAIVEDIGLNTNISGALEESYSAYFGSTVPPVSYPLSQANPLELQSSTRLAELVGEFPPEAVKDGRRGIEYKKPEDNAIA